MINTLTDQIAAVQQQIRDHFTQHPGLRSQRDLLISIPGIGETTAAVLLAELFDKRYSSARQAAAFAGSSRGLSNRARGDDRDASPKSGPVVSGKRCNFPGARRAALQSRRCKPSVAGCARRAKHRWSSSAGHAQTHPHSRYRRAEISARL